MSLPEVTDLRAVDRAAVYKAGQLAGTLVRERDDVVFTYDDAYLADPVAPAVAFSLPKSAAPVRSGAGAVPPFFAGLLPEGLRLEAMTAAARTSADDHLTLLLAVGADAIGDVQVLPVDAMPFESPPVLTLAGTSSVDFAAVFAKATSTDPTQTERAALPGVQVKVSAMVMSTPVDTTAGPAILKLEPPSYPHLARNEDLFLAMAGACGLPVPGHRILTDAAGRAGLLVARFDRLAGADGTWRRLAQEDACQVLGRYPAAKYRLTLQEVAAALASAVAAGGGSRPLALRRILETAAFSYLIGNGDLHGKNLSIRLTPAGRWEVTPAYDLVSTQPYLAWRVPMALPMYGRANRLTRRWWLDAAQRLGLPERAMARVLDRIVTRSAPWLDRLGDIGFDDRTTTRLQDLIDARRLELAG